MFRKTSTFFTIFLVRTPRGVLKIHKNALALNLSCFYCCFEIPHITLSRDIGKQKDKLFVYLQQFSVFY